MADKETLKCMLAGLIYMHAEEDMRDIIYRAERSGEEPSNMETSRLTRSAMTVNRLTPQLSNCFHPIEPRATEYFTSANTFIGHAYDIIMNNRIQLDKRIHEAYRAMGYAEDYLDEIVWPPRSGLVISESSES
jgi:hypothetical protein